VIASCHVRPDYYRDSVFLMRAAQEVRKVKGVLDAGMMMGTPANKRVLRAAGLLAPAGEAAGPGDLIIAVSAEAQDSADSAVAAAIGLLDSQEGERGAETTGQASWASLEGAVESDPEANVALISVPGEYAAAEARRALSRGLNVFLFSDNVPLAGEIQLKATGQSIGKLVMGPDCGTAIIDGVPLGFANAVPRGTIGVIGASGTGMQVVTCLLARSGMGVSQAIGTGSRDLTSDVGGTSTLQALDLLSRDPATEEIVLVSKVPSPSVADRVVARLAACEKPIVANFLGYTPGGIAANGLTFARMLEDVIPAVARLSGSDWPAESLDYWWTHEDVASAVRGECEGLVPGQDLIRGLYSGGTLCQEAALVLSGRGATSSVATALDGTGTIALPAGAHCLIDLGADEFTVGRPHPMIDLSLRSQLMRECAADPRVAVVLFDVVLGFGAHPDPATELALAVTAARANAADAGRKISFIASVCGTDADLQGLHRSAAVLQDAGVVVLPTNAQAARLACLVAERKLPTDDACSAVPWRSTCSLPSPVNQPLFGTPCRVVNVGLPGFFDTLRTVGAPAIQVDWRPPLGGDAALASRLAAIL
jgi:FdrA protein